MLTFYTQNMDRIIFVHSRNSVVLLALKSSSIMGTSPLVGCHEECTHSLTYPQSTVIHKERKSSKKKETAAATFPSTTHFSLNPLY